MRNWIVLALLLAGCESKWTTVDDDGDGWTVSLGDCDDADAAVHPEAGETWYDGVDQDCLGDDDFDQDGDGARSADHGGDDCWDDPRAIPEAYRSDEPTAQPEAAEVHPGAEDPWYDGVDQDCAGNDDYDQDGDGHASALETRADGGPAGDDCYDAVDPDCVTYDEADDEACDYPVTGFLTGDPFDPAEIHPGADDAWYDGTDQDCDGRDDYDQDGDGFPAYAECDDEDPTAQPDPDAEEIWYDGVDQDCDGNDGDQDGDGYVVADYPFFDDLPHAIYGRGDCWDDVAEADLWEPVHVQPGTPDAPGEVYPNADDAPYDGLDQDCAGDDDFDQDQDGWRTDAWTDEAGVLGEDCDDLADGSYPGAYDEWYDGVDADCLGNDDFDQDGDGFRSEAEGAGDDCVDTDAAIRPDTTETWYDGVDQDCDGWSDYDQDYDGDDSDAYGGGDCDETRPTVNSAVTEESCTTSYDDDCDGDTNDPDDVGTVGSAVYYYDGDGDGYGSTASHRQCRADATTGYDVTNDDDCDDASASDYPNATETVANGDDEDCDGVDSCYQDLDGDNYGTATVVDGSTLDCNTGTGSTVSTDCDDASAADNPGATEVVGNGDDDNCDGSETCYDDDDNDGYLDTSGDTRASTTDTDCNDPNEGASTDPTTDCDDNDATENPGVAEIVGNGEDDNCDGSETCYDDDDNDGYLDTSGDTRASTTNTDCNDPNEGASTDPTTDCDDTDATEHPGATEVVGNGEDDNCDGSETCYDDDDDDGYLDTSGDTRASTTDTDCNDPYEGASTAATTDCDDNDAADNPGATEVVGNGDDDNCDGSETCYDDDDNDGYLDTSGDTRASTTNTDCNDPNEGTSTDPTTDCDDNDATEHPGATEVVGNGEDDNCDGSETCYDDDDNDGYLDTSGDTRASTTNTDCNDPNEGASTDPTTDCDDNDAADHPGATEVVGNGDDDNCDGSETCYDDDDNDGYLDTSGDTRASTTNTDCNDPNEGTSTDPTTDCDDTDAAIRPSATEVCDAADVDEDCDGGADDDDPEGASGQSTWYPDVDGDTWGDDADPGADRCDGLAGEVEVAGDCDDTDPLVNPDEADPTDGSLTDDDCDGVADDDDLTAGSVVINEYFVAGIAPQDWVEVYNDSGVDLALDGWELTLCRINDSGFNASALPLDATDCDNTDVVSLGDGTFSLVVPAGGYAVLCRDASAFTPAACDEEFTYTNITHSDGLAANNGGFVLAAAGSTVDQVFWWNESGATTYGDWPTANNRSVEFDVADLGGANPHLANDDWSTGSSTADLWCLTSGTDWATSGTVNGTPGAANDGCP